MKRHNRRKKLINNKDNTNKRIKSLKYFTVILFSVISFRLTYLIFNMNSYYQMILNKRTDNIVYLESAPRGKIYDRNYKVLVDNIAVKKIYYNKQKGISVKEEIELACQVSKVLSLDYNNLLLRNLKEFYMAKYPDKVNDLITKKEQEDLENRKLTERDITELKIERITEEDLSVFSEGDKKCAYLYYLMNKGYYSDEKIIKVENVTDNEYAYISENVDTLRGFNTKLDWERVYPYDDTLRNILGSVSSTASGIPAEKASYYLALGYDLDDRVGISGIEEQYEEILKGEKSKYKVLDNNKLELVEEGQKGNDIVLAIDIDLQTEVESILKEEITKTKREANTKFYNRSFVVIQNPNTGEILSLAGKQILKNSLGNYEIYDYSVGTVTSTITPGSIVKGASIIVGYNAGVIDIGTVLYDTCIGLLNMPDKCSWKSLGYVSDLDALKWSSNVYQYRIAMMVGGFNYSPHKMLDLDLKAFDIYRSTFYQFGLGVTTGIDYPIEEDGYGGLSNDGDLLINFAIGQYDTYTPIQISQYISTIANGGKRIKPHLLKAILKKNTEKDILYEVATNVLNIVDTEDKYLNRVREGFRLCILGGTCVGYMGNSPTPSGKTGTSESFVDSGSGIYNHPTISNNFIGYAPTDNPIMSIAVSSPDVQDLMSGEYKSDVNYRISRRVSNAFFSLYNEKGERN